MKRKVSFRAPSYGSNLFHPFLSLSLFSPLDRFVLLDKFTITLISFPPVFDSLCTARNYLRATRRRLRGCHRKPRKSFFQSPSEYYSYYYYRYYSKFREGKKGDPVSTDFSSFAVHKFVNEREYFEESFRRECNMHTRVHADKTLEIFRPDQAQSRKRVQLKQRARLTGIVCTSRGCNPIVQRI